LASPQLVCGEGYVSGNLTVRSSFIRCRAIVSAANIRATGAPTKPIIELGGRDATAQPGPVFVDKFLIEMETAALGVHNYTTVVLHGNNDNTEANTYDNVTIDMKSNVPAASGTLDQFMGGFNGDGLVVELVGQTDNLRTRVRNLQLLNVGWPAASVGRSVIGSIWCDIDGLVLDGSAASTGDYSGPLMDIRLGNHREFSLFTTAGLMSSYSTATVLEMASSANLHGFRYHHRSSDATPAGPIFSLNGDCALEDGLIYINQNLTSGSPVVSLSSDRSYMRRVHVFLDGTSTGPLVVGDGSVECAFENCTLLWKNSNTNFIASFNTFSRSTCIGNKFFSSTGFLPTVDYVNSNGIPATANFATLNIILSGVLSTAPTVY
jgi:hypothetical protein